MHRNKWNKRISINVCDRYKFIYLSGRYAKKDWYVFFSLYLHVCVIEIFQVGFGTIPINNIWLIIDGWWVMGDHDSDSNQDDNEDDDEDDESDDYHDNSEGDPDDNKNQHNL